MHEEKLTFTQLSLLKWKSALDAHSALT